MLSLTCQTNQQCKVAEGVFCFPWVVWPLSMKFNTRLLNKRWRSSLSKNISLVHQTIPILRNTLFKFNIVFTRASRTGKSEFRVRRAVLVTSARKRHLIRKCSVMTYQDDLSLKQQRLQGTTTVPWHVFWETIPTRKKDWMFQSTELLLRVSHDLNC